MGVVGCQLVLCLQLAVCSLIMMITKKLKTRFISKEALISLASDFLSIAINGKSYFQQNTFWARYIMIIVYDVFVI